MPHVVVVGGGFAEVSATGELAKEGFQVTLIDRHPYNTFQPLLYQVATGGLNAGDVTYSLRYYAAPAAGSTSAAYPSSASTTTRKVICDDGVRVPFDYLILGTGITTNHFGIPGAADTRCRCTPGGALAVRDAIFGSLETIAGLSDPNTGAFTVVIVGGGATGVEMAGQLAELKTETIPSTYPELNPARVSVVLVEMTEHLLGPFDDSLRTYAARAGQARGRRRLNTAISRCTPTGWTSRTDPRCRRTWWSGRPGWPEAPEIKNWGLPVGQGGRIEANDDTGDRVREHLRRR